MSIFSIVGPPCASKSTMAARFVFDHPDWIHYSIDQCRDPLLRYSVHAEDTAWERLKDLVDSHPKVILETGGLSWRLPIMLDELTSHLERKYFVLSITGEAKIFHKRLFQRHKWYKPTHYKLEDEHASIDYTLERINSVYPYAKKFLTDNAKTEDDLYKEISNYILNAHKNWCF